MAGAVLGVRGQKCHRLTADFSRATDQTKSGNRAARVSSQAAHDLSGRDASLGATKTSKLMHRRQECEPEISFDLCVCRWDGRFSNHALCHANAELMQETSL